MSAGECSGLPEFFRILHILLDKSWKVYFVTARLSSWYMEHYRSYQLIENCYSDLEILDPETLNDYHPLAAYQVARTLMVTPRTPFCLYVLIILSCVDDFLSVQDTSHGQKY